MKKDKRNYNTQKIDEGKPRPFKNLGKSLAAHSAAFIPRHISNQILLRFFEILRWGHRNFGWDFSRNYDKNVDSVERNHLSAIRKNGGFIEDQFRYKDVALASTTLSYAGCEIIALYNVVQALRLTEKTLLEPGNPAKDLPDMIHAFESDGILLAGRLGTSPRALLDYLNRHLSSLGISAEWVPLIGDPSAIREISLIPGDCFILTYYNNGDNIMDQIHTICISKTADGRCQAHNVRGGKATPPFTTMDQMLKISNQDKAKGIVLIRIFFP